MQSNQIVNLNNVLDLIHEGITLDFNYTTHLSLLMQAVKHLKIKDLSGSSEKVIELIEKIEKTNFNLSEAYQICEIAFKLVLNERKKIIANEAINLDNLILELNKIIDFNKNFRTNEGHLVGILDELFNILQSLPEKKEKELIQVEGDDFSEYIEKLNKKSSEIIKEKDYSRACSNQIRSIKENCSDLIQRQIQVERFGEEYEAGEGDEDEEEVRRRREMHLLATKKLYILLNELNLSKEYIIGFIKHLVNRGKYPSSEKLEGWETDLLKLVNKKYKLDNFSFDEILKVATGDIVFLEARFKEDADVMKHLRDKILNEFSGSARTKIGVDDALYSLKKKSLYLDDDLKKTLYRYVMNNFETNNCLKLLKMFDRYSFPKFLNFYHHYVKKIDLSMLMIGKLYKFYDILKMADERTLESEFDSILAGIKTLGIKDDDKILGMINRGFMILRILHNNDYEIPDTNPKTYDFKFDNFLKDLFLSMLMSKWDLKQDVTDKFINIGLNSKIDDLMSRRGNKINMIAEKMEINLDLFRNDLMKIRGIISRGAEIPFSWREKIYQVDNDLNSLLSGEILLKYTSEVKEKDKRLFNLNYEMNDGMKFEVLPDMSLDHFKVGAATQCCQRPGGAAETSMIDSFVNGLAGVLVLKKGNNIISQSYFHYVPQDNGYILDNIEANVRLVKNNKINLDNLYANLANRIKADFGASYVKCGKVYNKLDDSLFETGKMDTDPRYFELESIDKKKVYSDFSEKEHLDLTNPKFPITKIEMRKKEANKFDRLLKFAEAFGVMVRFGNI